MVTRYLRRGVATGAIAGAILAAYLSVMVWLPAQHSAQAGTHHQPADTALPMSSILDVGSTMLWGALLGVAFAFVFFVFQPALPGSARTKPYALAMAGFVTMSAGPWLLIPPTPETVVQPLSSSARISLYLGGMAGGAVATGGSFSLYRRVATGRPIHRLLMSLTPICLLVIAASVLQQTVLPVIVPARTWPAIATVAAGQLLLWLVIATGFRFSAPRTQSSPSEVHTLSSNRS